MIFEDEDLIRYGGPQADDGGDDAARKAEERERKKAEVRKRLEEAGKKGNKKKGFLTPERKKKLRKLLMMKAAEDLKQQQMLKEQERQKTLQQRIIALPNLDTIDDQGKLIQIYEEMFARVCALEEEKYDINYLVGQAEAEINQLTIQVNDLRGKFVKPSLKKVSKYDNKFKASATGQSKEKADFRANLKVVKKETGIDEIMAKKKNDGKPEWSKKATTGEEEKKKEDGDAAQAAPAEEAPAEEPAPAEEEEEEEEEEE
ncbi:unnamed protein product [Caenorhabditis bovis]|uniref:Uncharacterized protein n=1 Tax=Caenorhabditis bovis TaxID=2654633 RepID=A0A8S1EIG8_9PELO|nr:unnamed protein product [Caenorhabditis bovis]